MILRLSYADIDAVVVIVVGVVYNFLHLPLFVVRLFSIGSISASLHYLMFLAKA